MITGSVIQSSEAYFGSGSEVTLDDDGITIAVGDGPANQIKFGSAARIYYSSVATALQIAGGDDGITFASSSGVGLRFDGSGTGAGLWPTSAGGLVLGTESLPFADLALSTVPSVGAAITDHESRIAALEALHE